MTYNFEEQSLTNIGKIGQRFNEFFTALRYNSIEYKDTVYFIAFDNEQQDNVRLKVGKLYQTSQREKIIFDKIIDRVIQIQRSNMTNRYMLFIKDDILCIYFFLEGLLFSLGLQDQQANIQQSPHLAFCSSYKQCFNNPYIYFIDFLHIYEIDCTDITDMKVKKSRRKANTFDLTEQFKAVFLNGKIYYYDITHFYQLDIETKATKRFSLDGVIPYECFHIKLIYIWESEIRVVGQYSSDNKQFFMKITIDDDNLNQPNQRIINRLTTNVLTTSSIEC